MENSPVILADAAAVLSAESDCRGRHGPIR